MIGLGASDAHCSNTPNHQTPLGFIPKKHKKQFLDIKNRVVNGFWGCTCNMCFFHRIFGMINLAHLARKIESHHDFFFAFQPQSQKKDGTQNKEGVNEGSSGSIRKGARCLVVRLKLSWFRPAVGQKRAPGAPKKSNNLCNYWKIDQHL